MERRRGPALRVALRAWGCRRCVVRPVARRAGSVHRAHCIVVGARRKPAVRIRCHGQAAVVKALPVVVFSPCPQFVARRAGDRRPAQLDSADAGHCAQHGRRQCAVDGRIRSRVDARSRYRVDVPRPLARCVAGIHRAYRVPVRLARRKPAVRIRCHGQAAVVKALPVVVFSPCPQFVARRAGDRRPAQLDSADAGHCAQHGRRQCAVAAAGCAARRSPLRPGGRSGAFVVPGYDPHRVGPAVGQVGDGPSHGVGGVAEPQNPVGLALLILPPVHPVTRQRRAAPVGGRVPRYVYLPIARRQCQVARRAGHARGARVEGRRAWIGGARPGDRGIAGAAARGYPHLVALPVGQPRDDRAGRVLQPRTPGGGAGGPVRDLVVVYRWVAPVRRLPRHRQLPIARRQAQVARYAGGRTRQKIPGRHGRHPHRAGNARGPGTDCVAESLDRWVARGRVPRREGLNISPQIGV